jgi:tetratricopeptide (TPR) repeat protein
MKNRFLIQFSFILPSILSLLIAQAVRAQYDPGKVNKKAAQLYSKGMELAQNDDFKGGIEALQQAIRIDSTFEDAYLSLGGMYQELKNYRGAIENYEKARSVDSSYFLDYNLPYSINLAGIGEFDKALQAVNIFLTINNLNETSRKAGQYRKACYQFAIDYAKSRKVTDYKFEPLNMGDSINS